MAWGNLHNPRVVYPPSVMRQLSLTAYRNLLRAVRKHLGKEDRNSHFTDFIKHEFRRKYASKHAQDAKLAEDYAFYLNSVHHQKELLFSYNIAVDRSAEMKKVLGKSAASVGLQLPEVYQA